MIQLVPLTAVERGKVESATNERRVQWQKSMTSHAMRMTFRSM